MVLTGQLIVRGLRPPGFARLDSGSS